MVAVFAIAGCVNLTSPIGGPGGPGTSGTSAVSSTQQVTGKVLGLDGKPAANVSIHGYLISNNAGGLRDNRENALISNNAGSYRVASTALDTRSSSDGTFKLPVTSGDTLNVEAVLSNDVKAIQLAVSSTAQPLALQLAYTGTLAGRVTTPDRPSVTDFLGVDVYVPGTSYTAKTDSAGRFSIGYVAAGTFALVASKASLGMANQTGVIVRPRETTTVSDLALALDAPVLAKLTPDYGVAGSVITLSGTNFKTSTGEIVSVSFGGKPATAITAVDDQTLRVTVPAGASSGDLTLTVGGIAANPVKFHVVSRLTMDAGNLMVAVGDRIDFPIGAIDTDNQAIASASLDVVRSGEAAALEAGQIVAHATGETTLTAHLGSLSLTRHVRVLDRLGQVETIAGGVTGMTDGHGTAAQFDEPFDLVLDTTGNLMVADLRNDALRRVTLDGEVTTIAGDGEQQTVDGVGRNAGLDRPTRLALDPQNGDIYFTEYYADAIRKIDVNLNVTTLFNNGTGLVNGDSSVARFHNPEGIALGPDHSLYVAEQGNHCIRRISPEGVVSTLAGNGQPGFLDGTGAAARFNQPEGVAVDAQGNVIVVDASNHAIRKVTPAGVVTTLAGTGAAGSFNGNGREASFSLPYGVTIAPNGDILIAEHDGNLIRLVTPDGVVFTRAGTGAQGQLDGPASQAQFFHPAGLILAPDGTLYVVDAYTDSLRKLTP